MLLIILQVLELQNTLDELAGRVGSVREENTRLRTENSVLGKYIESLMHAADVYQGKVEGARRSGGNGKEAASPEKKSAPPATIPRTRSNLGAVIR